MGRSHGGPQAQPADDRTERSFRQALSAKLLRARREYLDLARPHPGTEYGQLAVARIGALAGQRVELPLVVRAGKRAPVKVALAELETQVGKAVLEGPDLAPGVEQDNVLRAQPDPRQLSFPEVVDRHQVQLA